MNLRRTMFTLAAAAVVSLATAVPAHADQKVTFKLDELNGSGSQATATLTARDDGSLHVKITGDGFTPNSPHAQHIHGAAHSRNFFCPPASADKDGDGQIATEEGLSQYGDVFVSLTTKGDTSKKSGLAVDRMPVADESGRLSYERTIPASGLPAGTIDSLQHLHIVQHGLDVNGNDKYDMAALGESVFAKSLGVSGIPEEATNPATCGEVAATGGVETGADSTGGVENLGLFAAGGIALLGAGAVLTVRRRVRVTA
ncbi:hypothetical protein E1218_16170 [Kribbella turkmenica]|uniref:CHRD domain-containing protein n=1 Tax=Kribbella turkmenica TaxID=2530375 RepID=A0A4R4X3C2_9ACTN|nr:hypothetical protein [Kribbella turkmenica]TDD24685.1 hypothetical protein E1218_16170 [Kribbella turkmenica]